MCQVIDIIAGAAIGYLIGGFPTGYLVVKWKAGKDVRKVGSSSTGATNVSRVLGKKIAAAVALVDALKGILAYALVYYVLGARAIPEIAAVSAVVGHCFPVYLGFHGGKGVSTAFGAALIVATLPAVVAFGVFLFALLVARRVSAASLTAVWTFAGCVFLFDNSLPIRILGVFLALFITFTHRENIKRLLSGQEKPIFGVR